MNGGMSVWDVFEVLTHYRAVRAGPRYFEDANLNPNDQGQQWLVKVADPIIVDLYEQVSRAGINFDAVVSIPSGGDMWASKFMSLEQARNKRRVLTYALEKHGGGKAYVDSMFTITQESEPSPGTRVLLVDDTMFAGSTSMKVATTLMDYGCIVAGIVCPVVIGKEGVDMWDLQGVPVVSTFNERFLKRHKGKYPLWCWF